MGFPRAAIVFITLGFAFLIIWAACSRIMTEIDTAVEPLDDNLGSTYEDQMNLLPAAFGIISAIFFVTGIIMIFVMESLSDEPEYYYRRY